MVDADGVIPLAVGRNEIAIEVTAENGRTVRTYTITVTRTVVTGELPTDDPPVNFRVTGFTDTAAAVQWEAPRNRSISTYELQRYVHDGDAFVSSGAAGRFEESTTGGSGHGLGNLRLEPDTRYRYVLMLKDDLDTTVIEASVTVRTSPAPEAPANTEADDEGTVSLLSVHPRVDTSLTASLNEPDGDVSDLTWAWERSPDQAAWTSISGATSDAYTPVADDEGDYLRARAQYTDAFGAGKRAEYVSASPVQLPTPAPPPAPPPASSPSGSPGPSAPTPTVAPATPAAPAGPTGVVGRTSAATAMELPGNRVRIDRHDGGASLVIDIGGFIRDADLGQTYQVVRRADGAIVRQWIAPNSPLVYQIPWAVVNSSYTVPVGVVGSIPLDDQFGSVGQLVRRFDGGDDRIFSYAAGQWRHVPDIPTFQALGFYWCEVTAADASFFERISMGPAHPASDVPARDGYPNCSTG